MIKTTYLFLIFILSTVAGYSQCDITYEYDKFNKHTIAKSEERTVIGKLANGIYISGIKRIKEDSPIYILKVRTVSTQLSSVSTDGRMLFLLSNKQIVETTISKYGIGKLRSIHNGVYDLVFHVSITEEELMKFGTGFLESIRIEYTEGYRDRDIPKKLRGEMTNLAGCLYKAKYP